MEPIFIKFVIVVVETNAEGVGHVKIVMTLGAKNDYGVACIGFIKFKGILGYQISNRFVMPGNLYPMTVRPKYLEDLGTPSCPVRAQAEA